MGSRPNHLRCRTRQAHPGGGGGVVPAFPGTPRHSYVGGIVFTLPQHPPGGESLLRVCCMASCKISTIGKNAYISSTLVCRSPSTSAGMNRFASGGHSSLAELPIRRQHLSNNHAERHENVFLETQTFCKTWNILKENCT